jgi:hypothetical protein
MIVLWAVLAFIGYTIVGTVTAVYFDHLWARAIPPRTLDGWEHLVLGSTWPIFLACLPALLTHRLLKWAIRRRQLAALDKAEAVWKATREEQNDLSL